MRPPKYLPPRDFRATRGLVGRLVILVLLLIGAFQSISFYVESLWYGSLGFESVYWYRLRAQFLVFLGAGALTTAALWTIFRVAAPPAGYARRPFLRFGDETITIPTSETLRGLA